MQNTRIKGVKFIFKNKAEIDLVGHADIMEDAIDRTKVREALNTGEFIDWEDAKKLLQKKHGINELSDSNRKKSAKISSQSSHQRFSQTAKPY
ncbi:MAG TPA: hypothetical protein VGP55_04995 [Chitinophagaceae bacterium]|nr:hypothetical protein [Chitinophagaceae bacterium]